MWRKAEGEVKIYLLSSIQSAGEPLEPIERRVRGAVDTMRTVDDLMTWKQEVCWSLEDMEGGKGKMELL
jgi:hypothetical protein